MVYNNILALLCYINNNAPVKSIKKSFWITRIYDRETAEGLCTIRSGLMAYNIICSSCRPCAIEIVQLLASLEVHESWYLTWSAGGSGIE